MSQNLSSAAVVIGDLRVKLFLVIMLESHFVIISAEWIIRESLRNGFKFWE